MASSSSSASMASSSSHCTTMYTGEYWEHDVFLCFRGDDTRHGFTSHLMAALSDKKIKAFIDTMLCKTESIDELLSVVERSALSIVIFSEKFADSPWCLDEVATIAQSMAKFGHRALPVFYKVGWTDVAGDSGSYSVTIDDKLNANADDNKRWRDGLKAVANCAGRTSQSIQTESELIKAIVEDVQKLLIDMSPSIKSENLVGMGSRIWEVEQLLAMDELDDTRIIGLWGMGGAGKTTLAKACYERIVSSRKDVKHHFIRNINQICEKQHGVDGIVHELYSKVLSESNLSFEDLDIHYRRSRLSRSKVFIVLDDVETPCQLEQLLLGDVFNVTKLFAAGSRIIVTTRNKKVLQNAMAKIYNVACLDDCESLQLFSLRTFGKNSPPDNWVHLSRRAKSYCKGNPLVLRVLGRSLFGEDRDYWESFLSGLSLIQNPEIHDVLRRSYDKMGADEKQLFLDVAYFLHGISRSRLIGYMATLYPSAHAKLKDLIDKSLLICICTKDGENIEVHGLLKEMAVNIVNEESKLGKRSRLVDPDDIHKLLTTTKVKYWTTFFIKPFFKSIEMMVLPRRKRRNVSAMNRKGNSALEGLRTTQGISLDLSKAKEMHLAGNAFQGMDSLTFLKFYSYRGNKKKIYLPYGGLDSLPDGLRWLHWDQYPSKSLPSGFHPQHLVHLIIRGSPIEKCWEGFDQPKLVNLMVLDLSYCINLTAVPDLSRSLQLEELLLQGCQSLVELPGHVQYLDKLTKINLVNCVNLERLPSKLNSKFLKHVLINRCPKVRYCPELNSGELMRLDLNGTPVKELPSAVYSVKRRGSLHLSGKNLIKSPAISVSLRWFGLFHTAIKEIDSYDHHQASQSLPIFYSLDLTGNLQLKSLPKNIWNMISSSLNITGSPFLESLPEISEPVDGLSLRSLTLKSTGIKSLPSSIQELDRLRKINLSYCKSLESIPSSIHKLPYLYKLDLRGCGSILSLPQVPPSLSELDVSGCKSLQALPSNASELSWESLRFHDCPQLDRMLPDEIVANYPVHAPMSPRFRNELVYSGNEISEWFAYKSMNDKDNSCLMVQLPPANSTRKQLLKRIAFGVVWSLDAPNVLLDMECECNFGTITIASWSYLISLDTLDGTNSSDQVLLWSDKRLSGKIDERKGGEGEEAWHLKYAGHTVSFRFYPCLGSKKNAKHRKNFNIKRCGVSLLYSN